jgi:aspartate aminotransferase-like enzyme
MYYYCDVIRMTSKTNKKNSFETFYQIYGKLIYAPGPTMVAPEVRTAMSKPLINPDLDPDFPQWFLETCKRTAKIMETNNEILILPGEGMLALDAAINSCIKKDDKVLVLASGIFGHGFANMVKDCKGDPIKVATDDYSEVLTAKQVKKALDEQPDVDVVTLVHCETPSGTLNPLKEIGKVCQKHDILLIVDAVSSLGGTEVKTDKWGVDICLGASQKCFSAPPGIAFLSLSQKALDIIDNRKQIPTFYSDLKVWKNSWIDNRRMPYTHSISNLYGFRKTIDMILEEGLVNMQKRHKIISDGLVAALESINLELFPKKKESISPTVTAFKKPKNIEADQLINHLWEKYGVLIAGAWGPVLGGKILRLGNMGYAAQPKFAVAALSALEKALLDLGHTFEKGESIKTFLEMI